MVTSLKWALVLKNVNPNIASKLAAVCSVFIPTVSIKDLIKISRKEENICCINTVLMHRHPSMVLMADWNQLPWMIGTLNSNSLFYSSILWFCPTSRTIQVHNTNLVCSPNICRHLFSVKPFIKLFLVKWLIFPLCFLLWLVFISSPLRFLGNSHHIHYYINTINYIICIVVTWFNLVRKTLWSLELWNVSF